MATTDLPAPLIDHRWRLVWLRLALLLLSAALMIITGYPLSTATALLAITLVAVASSFPMPGPRFARLQPVAEAALVAAIVITVNPLPEALLPYLMAPAFAAGLLYDLGIALATIGAAATVLLVGPLTGLQDVAGRPYVGAVGEWLFIALAVALLGVWVRRLAHLPPPPENASYAAAYRLISQLRMVSRQLSGGLDTVRLAASLLQSLDATLGFDRAAVLVRSPGGRLVPIAVEGATQLDWDTRTGEGSPFADAWATDEPVLLQRALTPGCEGVSAVLPLKIGVRTFGVVGLERSGPPYDHAGINGAASLVAESALRLETALLFDEVRQIATSEERRRVAREIHDGIAQELASLGYIIDGLTAQSRYLPELEGSLRKLRTELSRIITDLRLSIFDLRTDVEATTGLGTALSDYVRQVGAGSNFTVHLVLDETPVRLPIQTEAELLRIAQEAITNARKHANAENLWVTCRVDPPNATIQVEDDGRGLGSGRPDSFGMEIMRERAARVGADIDVRNRDDGGTVVSVTLAHGTRRER